MPMLDHPELMDAIERFVKDNTNFESSMVVKDVVKEIMAAGSTQAAFNIPISHRLFNMETSLKWVFFLYSSCQREGYPEKMGKFSANTAMNLIHKLYDYGLEDHVENYYGEDSEDEEDEEDDEDVDLTLSASFSGASMLAAANS